MSRRGMSYSRYRRMANSGLYTPTGLYIAANQIVVPPPSSIVDGRDITPQNTGLAAHGYTEADLTSRAGGTFASGTYEGYLFTSQVRITGPCTFRHCKWKTTGDGDASASIHILGNGTDPALIEYCDFTSANPGVWPGTGPSQDRTVMVGDVNNGNMPFTFQYNYAHDNCRGVYFGGACHGISALYPRIVQWNYLGNFFGTGGQHTSCLAIGNGSHTWWFEFRGNRMINNSPQGMPSGCLQMYPEFSPNSEFAYGIVEKNFFEGTSGQYETTIGYTPVTETCPHDLIFQDNWYGRNPMAPAGYSTVASSSDKVFSGENVVNSHNNVWRRNHVHAPGHADNGRLISP